MISDIIEWSFDCDQASDIANAAFDTMMNRDWLIEHGISPFDTDAAWEEVRKHLSRIGEPFVLTATKITQGTATVGEQLQLWTKMYGILVGGEM